MTKRCLNLRGHIHVPFVFTAQIQIPQIIQSDPAIIRGNQNFILARHRFNSTYFPAGRIFTSCRSHMYLGMVFQLIRIVEQASSIITSDNSEFSILTEICSCNQLGLTIDLIPQGHLLIRDIPQSQFSIQTATQEVTIIPRMETNGGDKINMLETAQTPESNLKKAL